MPKEVAWVRFYHCLSVCFPDDVSKTDEARITKLDIQMSHDESWKPIYVGFKRSKVEIIMSVSFFRQNAMLLLHT